jgi:hypothetical protein
LFAVRWVPRSVSTEITVTSEGTISAEELSWVHKNTFGWFTMLAWTCWKYAGDPDEGPVERAYWWSLLNVLMAHLNRHGSPKPKEGTTLQTKVVLPAGLVKHRALFGGKEGYGLPWHQLSLLHHTGLSLADFTSAKTIRGMIAAIKGDLTNLMFDPEHANRILTIPVDPSTTPFFPNPVNPGRFSVVDRIVGFKEEEPLDDLAFVDEVVDKLSTTFRSHAVDPQVALERALEIAVAALAVASGRSISAKEIEGLKSTFHAQSFDYDHAVSWVRPFTEATKAALQQR